MKEIATVEEVMSGGSGNTDARYKIYINDIYMHTSYRKNATYDLADKINKSFETKPKEEFVNADLDAFNLIGFLKKLDNGDIFYTRNGYKIYFNMNSEFPYRWNDDDLNINLWYGKLDELKIKKQVEWYENITKPVPCWIPSENERFLDFIVDYKNGVFFGFFGAEYLKVIPASLDDIEVIGE